MPRPKSLRPWRRLELCIPQDVFDAVAARLADPVRSVLYQTERGARYGKLSKLVTELLEQWLAKNPDCTLENNPGKIEGDQECQTVPPPQV